MLRRCISWLDRRVGNRGELLILFGVPWIIVGLGFVLVPMERFSRPGPGGPLETIDNGPYPAVLWVLGGVLAIVCAFTRLKRQEDSYGFFGVIMPPLIWSGLYYTSWLSNVVSEGELGRPNTWIAGTVYLSVTIIPIFLSLRFKDLPPVVHIRAEGP